MTLADVAAGPVYLSSGRWVRNDVRRYPKGVCPRCRYQGCLKRNPVVPVATDPEAWITRQHRDPSTGEWCIAHDAIARPIYLPSGWE